LNLTVLIVFTNFCFSNQNVVQFLLPQPKNRSRAYMGEAFNGGRILKGERLTWGHFSEYMAALRSAGVWLCVYHASTPPCRVLRHKQSRQPFCRIHQIIQPRYPWR